MGYCDMKYGLRTGSIWGGGLKGVLSNMRA